MHNFSKVMVVEDEAIIACDIQDELESLGYDVCANTGVSSEALELFDAKKPEIILMDIFIQGELDGIQVAQRILEKNDVPIIFLTAYSDDDTVKRARSVAPYGYLLKPFTQVELNVSLQVAIVKYQMMQELKRANLELEIFNKALSHDLKTPFRNILAYIYLIEKKLETDNNMDAITTLLPEVKACAENGMNYLRDLQYLTLVQNKEVSHESFHLSAVVKEILKDYNHSDFEHIQFKLSGLKEIYSDLTLIKIMLNNLIGNAVKYAFHKEEPVIEIGCLIENNEQILYVKDNGLGIAKEHLNSIFELYHRLPTELNIEGNGIGLATVKQVSELLGAQIMVLSELGKGSTFKIQL